MISSIKVTFSTTTNQESEVITLACISLLQLHITFLMLLTLILRWKFVAFFSIYLKHLIEFGMTVSFVNPIVMELTVTSLNLFHIFFIRNSIFLVRSLVAYSRVRNRCHPHLLVAISFPPRTFLFQPPLAIRF